MFTLKPMDDGGRELTFDTPWGRGHVAVSAASDGEVVRMTTESGRYVGTALVHLKAPQPSPGDEAIQRQIDAMGKGCCGD